MMWSAAPASASTTTIVSTTGFTAQAGANTFDCTTQTETSGLMTHDVAPSGAHSGTGALKLGLKTRSITIIGADAMGTTPAASTISALSEKAYLPGSAGLDVQVWMNPAQNGNDFAADVLFATVATTGGWQSLDYKTMGYTWYHVTISNGNETQTHIGDGNYASFISGHASYTFGYVELQNDSCGAGVWYADDLTIGIGATVNDYDFEPDSKAGATIDGPLSATYGKAITLTGQLDSDGRNDAEPGKSTVNKNVTNLQARTSSSTAWKTIKTVTSNATGGLTTAVSPSTTTQYRWQYDGDPGLGPLASTPAMVTVKVHPKLAFKVSDKSLTEHQKLSVSGKLTPLLKGVKVTVYDVKGSLTKELGSAKTSSKGKWKLSKKSPLSGKSTVYAKSAKKGSLPSVKSKKIHIKRA